MSSLKQLTVSGMIWSGVQRFGTMGISFISNMVLARLLTPDDFGCIGMLAIFIALSNTFIDGGFGSALIQKKNPTQEDYSTIFYWNILLGILLYILLYIIAPYISTFYKIPLLNSVLRIQGLVLIINSFAIIQANQLRKQLLFRKLAIVNIIATLCSVIIAIFMAYKGKGVWSLVVQQLSSSFFYTLLLWIVCKWKPSLTFSFDSFKSLFNFGSFILLSSFINTLFNNINGLIIGKLFSPATMGYFSQAKKVEEVSAISITHIIEQVTYPLLSECQNDHSRVRSILSKVNLLLLYVVTPIMLLINLLSEQIIVVLFSSKWLEAAPYLQILAIQGIMITLQGVNYNALAAIGKSRVLFSSTVVKRCTSIIFMLLGVFTGGIIGLLWGMTVSSCFIAIYNMFLVRKYINYPFRDQFKGFLPILIVCMFAYIIGYYCKSIYSHSIVLSSLLVVGGFILVYIFLSYILKVPCYTIILDIIKDKFHH